MKYVLRCHQVSVRFTTIDGSAHYGRDYTVTSTDVMMASGERVKRVPIEIVDDQLSEVEETFTVRLIGPPTGGAVLGEVTETLVAIRASDDPYGAFGKYSRFIRKRVIVSNIHIEVNDFCLTLGHIFKLFTTFWLLV